MKGNVEDEGIGIGGTSGHSYLRMIRFAFGGYGPFASMLIIFFAKDMYVLKLGACTKRIGIIATMWSILFPIMYPIAGYLLDREPPVFTFWPKLGRLGPWYLIHLPILSVTVGLIYLPGLTWLPPAQSPVLDAWLGVCLLIAGWCFAVLLCVFEGARAEIYPFKEERVIVQALTKLVGVFASITGILPQLILWTVSTLAARAVVSIVLVICVLLSLVFVPVLGDARQPRTEIKVSWLENIEVLRSPAMFHATCVRFWHSAADICLSTFGIYYLTFVCGYNSAERAQWFVVGGAITSVAEVCIYTPLYGMMWSIDPTKPSRIADSGLLRYVPSLQNTCAVFHVFGAILPPLALRLISVPGWDFVIYSFMLRLFYSPQMFFRMISLCWAIDDDCHRNSGRRREAVHAGVIKFFEEQGRTVAFALFLGLGAAGLQTGNCEQQCHGASERADCVAACEELDIQRQPEVAREYIIAMLTYVTPVLGLLCAFHIWRFPIHGEVLQNLQARQATAFKNVQTIKAEVYGDTAVSTCSTTGFRSSTTGSTTGFRSLSTGRSESSTVATNQKSDGLEWTNQEKETATSSTILYHL